MGFVFALARPGAGRACAWAACSAGTARRFAAAAARCPAVSSVSAPRSPTTAAAAGLVRGIRQASSAGRAATKPLPERLLVYHAGTPRTTFLACLKVTTVFGLAFFTFLVAPAYVAASKPLWQVLGVAACGIVPFAVVTYTSAPFVAFVHLRLPAYARHPDPALLRRFVRHVPPSTRLDFTTMNLVGRPRHTSVAAGDLVPVRERLRIANLAVASPPPPPAPLASPPGKARAAAASFSSPPSSSSPRITISSKFPWVHLPPVTRFGAPADGNSRGVRDGWAWDELLAAVARRPRTTK